MKKRFRIIFSSYAIGFYPVNKNRVGTMVYLITKKGSHYDFRLNKNGTYIKCPIAV